MHEEERGAHAELRRIRLLDIPGHVERFVITHTSFPQGHPYYQPQEVLRWAVLISKQVDRRAILIQLYPQLASRKSLSATLASYEGKH